LLWPRYYCYFIPGRGKGDLKRGERVSLEGLIQSLSKRRSKRGIKRLGSMWGFGGGKGGGWGRSTSIPQGKKGKGCPFFKKESLPASSTDSDCASNITKTLNPQNSKKGEKTLRKPPVKKRRKKTQRFTKTSEYAKRETKNKKVLNLCIKRKGRIEEKKIL